MMDKISIHKLAVQAIIGIHDWERRERQPVTVDLDMFLDTANAAKTDSIEDTVSYGDVSRLVSELVMASKYNLIESLAAAVADAILAGFPIERIAVTVSKPDAIANANNVSVTIERSR